MSEAENMTAPELDVRWRRLSISARGRDAIDAIRWPLFVMLIANAIALMLVVIGTVMRPEWSAVAELVAVWGR